MQAFDFAGRARALAAAGFIIAGLTASPGTAFAQSTLPSTGTIAIPTYEAVGLYWQSPGGSAGCEVKYRKAGATAWAQGLGMWYDARDTQCRGSLVGLEPNTSYQVEFNLPGQAATRGLAFKTWSNQRPVAKTITVNGGSGTLNVAESGTAAGYVVYDGKGATLDGQNTAQYNVTINASYVILRGLNLKGAKQDAIRISPNVKDVVIEDNDISGWGRTRDGKWGADMDSGIRAVCATPTLERVTIQRNKIHDPRYGANSWSDGHPAGPQAITISYCAGNHVIRHNDMYSNNGNQFNDVIGGEDNFTKTGFPNADTDIYGNRLANAWDDGIEAEGANENVRIWGNYIDRTAIGIATTVASVGPLYIFRNVYNRNQFLQSATTNTDADDRQVFLKSGSDSSLGNGRRYVFHNTMLQATRSGALYPLGAGAGIGGTGSSQPINNTWSKNNIYHLWKPNGVAYQYGTGNVFANDLYNGSPGEATYTGGMVGTPVYAPGNGWASEAGGMYQLASNSPGFGRGVRIANFNDSSATPDVGAHQAGTAAMKFGVAASRGSAVGAPTTTTPPPSSTTYVLGITAIGTGVGTVTSSPAGINCGSTCSTAFASGTTVSLSATPASGAVFSGWSGACAGTAPCTISMNAAKSVTATFTKSTLTGSVAASATALTFANLLSRQSVKFTNNTSASITFQKPSVSSTRYTTLSYCGVLARGASCLVYITYFPTLAGSHIATFTMTSNAPNSPHVVKLNY